RCAMSLLEDINMEERNPQIKVEIADGVLDEEAIERWWQRYNYEAASFHTIKKNCSTTVIRALRAGGSDRYALLAADWLSKRTGWEPTDVVDYLRRMARSVGAGHMTITRNPAFRAESVLADQNDPEGFGNGGLCHHGFNM